VSYQSSVPSTCCIFVLLRMAVAFNHHPRALTLSEILYQSSSWSANWYAMETKYLVGFLVLSEELHFGRAAARLGVAQPALSQQIRHLEDDLGRVLFDRSTRAVSLTEAGASLIAPVKRMLSEFDTVRRTAALGELGETGKVVIGFTGLTSRHLLPLLTRAVRSEYPGIELSLAAHAFSRAAITEVVSGGFDIAFTRLPVSEPSLSYRFLGYESLVLALPSDHPRARDTSLRLADFADEPFVCYPSAQGSRIREALMVAATHSGFNPRVVQEAPDTYTLLSLVAAGVGVALTVSSVQEVQVPGLVFRTLSDSIPDLETALVWRHDNPSKAMRSVLHVAFKVLPHPSSGFAEIAVNS